MCFKKTTYKNYRILQINYVDVEDDATGDEIQFKFADIAKQRWGKRLSSEKIKSLVKQYKQPRNCYHITGIKVNPEIGSHFDSKKRKADLKISNL